MIVRLDARHRGRGERGADPALGRRLGRPGGAGSERERGLNGVMGSGGVWRQALRTRLGRPGGAGSQLERGMNDVMGSGGEWKARQVRTGGAGFAPASAGEARQW